MEQKIIGILFLLSVNTTLIAQNHFTVEVSRLVADKGYVYFGLFDKKSAFLNEDAAFANAKVKATGTKVSYTFKNLPVGDYAVAVYQDENNNERCDKNMIGYPTEGFGFSNNYKPKFSAPKFDDVKINIKNSTKTNISLIGN
ncbi:DUF2141 domain-containing protein [Chryseobacterium wangxinyae]|uniref:DUF2141 domain-containing protein n=1 Tax=Chryseobacterium sp. CY350 TaxID=2997336 RepID=UPI0022715771|nr:DUF2141 domain-containing protein [Chryseobacterium sp. CY350]MCY0976670.1 DUF2141 domain-containing protein [Chryseobacterium sp. CY350]WBZ96671.1 DUF2141 domain-containing protein [Chryseobacterium sp. CY350]